MSTFPSKSLSVLSNGKADRFSALILSVQPLYQVLCILILQVLPELSPPHFAQYPEISIHMPHAGHDSKQSQKLSAKLYLNCQKCQLGYYCLLIKKYFIRKSLKKYQIILCEPPRIFMYTSGPHLQY